MQAMKPSEAAVQLTVRDTDKAIKDDDPFLILIGMNGQIIAGIPHAWIARFMSLDTCLESMELDLDNYEMSSVKVGPLSEFE